MFLTFDCCDTCASKMTTRVDMIGSVVDMLAFLDAPLYWKRIVASSLTKRSAEAASAGESESPTRWYLPPNPEQVVVSTDKVGVGRLFF